MMRLGRRATLLVTLSLLTSAATAYAECAWVLWVQVSEGGGSRPWEVIQAVETRQQCDQIVQAKVNQPGNDPIGKTLGNVAILKTDKGNTMFHFLCLPDTVDPRGPKGGGR